MDSGNTSGCGGGGCGSIQSSSGGDDQEFDSRPPPQHSVFPSFFSSLHSSSSPTVNPQIIFNQQNNFFDNPSNFFQQYSFSPPSPPPPLPNNPDSSNPPSLPRGAVSDRPSFPSDPTPSSSAAATAEAAQPRPGPVVTRNPKKRTRASRRAPTTVLTTDTSNFRAMVQEFTGIPAPPFSSSAAVPSSPYARRFDLFGSGGGFASSLFPPRPSPQKMEQLQQQTQFLIPPPSPSSANGNGNSNFNSIMQNSHQLLSLQSLLGQSLGGGGGGVKSSLPSPLPASSLDDLCTRGNSNESLWRPSDVGGGSNGGNGSHRDHDRLYSNVTSSRAHEGGGGVGGAAADSWICSEINEAK